MSLPTRASFKCQIQSIDAGRFERFVADVWRARGWTVRITQDGSDRGVDVVATKTEPFNQKEVIQAKRYSDDNPVGSPQIQQYASLRQQENADTVIVVTSGRFSKQAEELARQLNVKLIDGDSLYNLIESEGLDAAVSEYLATDKSGAETNSTGSVSTAPQSSETPASTEAGNTSQQHQQASRQTTGVANVTDDTKGDGSDLSVDMSHIDTEANLPTSYKIGGVVYAVLLLGSFGFTRALGVIYPTLLILFTVGHVVYATLKHGVPRSEAPWVIGGQGAVILSAVLLVNAYTTYQSGPTVSSFDRLAAPAFICLFAGILSLAKGIAVTCSPQGEALRGERD